MYVYVDVLVCQDRFSYQEMGFPAVEELCGEREEVYMCG